MRIEVRTRQPDVPCLLEDFDEMLSWNSASDQGLLLYSARFNPRNINQHAPSEDDTRKTMHLLEMVKTQALKDRSQ
jgi:hypothetical protein